MYVNKLNDRCAVGLIFLIALAISFALGRSHVHAGTLDMKGTISVPYEGGIFSSDPDDEDRLRSILEAKVQGWNLYTALFNAAKMKQYLQNKEYFIENIDDFVQHLVIIEESVDKDKKNISIVYRATINETAVNAILNNQSTAGTQLTAEGSPFVFVFLSRQASEVKEYKSKETSIEKIDGASSAKERAVATETDMVSSMQSSAFSKINTGGSVERKADTITYEVASSQDIDSAMGNVLSVAGFEPVSYDDVISACGGIERTVIADEFRANDDMSRTVRESALNACRVCEVPLFAVGTIDVGMHDVDQVSGNKRVFVSVRGQVWDISKLLPRKVASVGPVQYSGLGPDATVARRNALILASEFAAKEMVDQLNAKGIR